MIFKFQIDSMSQDNAIVFVGSILYGDELIILQTPHMKSEKSAIRLIQSMWQRSVFCSHEYRQCLEDTTVYKCVKCDLMWHPSNEEPED